MIINYIHPVSKPLSFSLIIIALIIGMGLGFTLTPEYAAMKVAAVSMDLGPADRFLDQRFINGLISHHLTAIDMSRQALDKSHREDIRTLSEKIIKDDEEAVKKLYQLKLDWYKDGRQVSQFTRINLGDNDGKFDLRFINALVTHHDEGIETSMDVRTKSNRTEVLNLADSAIINLTASKDQLLSWRQDWYGF
ncbi:hypothetical protein A2368_04750 [Candidatus Collierbacteria bacterium RIFOXYB1_FULL_49_13]|uniref:DUF305 domain-containing protein n=1 Tax=Candidatus Collierbacteria bacterium RIFOXYB1_FULL_49_13 TaxID=1817728 RepID=A0A1F5FFA2_9BACT|nr:MAG: hypothetical protein A2368_04750 [Candidatus Collierbacteria bacterium RIFOXYB1_FULL_49_13]